MNRITQPLLPDNECLLKGLTKEFATEYQSKNHKFALLLTFHNKEYGRSTINHRKNLGKP
jgi:hypothetical protein